MIRAFTIVEIIVVMLITAIVISASMLLYNSMNRIQQSSFSKGEEEAAFVLLTDVLRKDCNQSSFIRFSNDVITCQKPKETVMYELNLDCIVRKTASVDSFPFAASNLEVEYADKGQEVLKAISFTFILKKDTIPFYYYKEYGAAFYLNNDE